MTGDVEAKICTIACSDPPEGVSRWTMQAIADELIRLEDVFMISEPLAGRRETVVTQTRTALDFAGILKYTSDTLYPRTERIILVTDNLNTLSPASLYKAFPPEEARRLSERFEWHYTPKHGSWLDRWIRLLRQPVYPKQESKICTRLYNRPQ